MASVADRFPSASLSVPPTSEQVSDVSDVHFAVVRLAELLDDVLPEGRDKSIALTSLEDVFMRAERAICGGVVR